MFCSSFIRSSGSILSEANLAIFGSNTILASVNSFMEVFWIRRMEERDSLIGFELASATNTPEPGLILNKPEVSKLLRASRTEIRLA